MNQIKIVLISLVYLPVAIILWTIYGIYCGVIGNTIGTIEFIWHQSRQKYLLWKRFPDVCDEVWRRQSAQVRSESKKTKKVWAYAEKKEEDKNPPFLVHVFLYAFWGFGLWPFKVIGGCILGPILGIVYAIDGWQRVILNMPPEDRLDQHFKTEMEGIKWDSEEN